MKISRYRLIANSWHTAFRRMRDRCYDIVCLMRSTPGSLKSKLMPLILGATASLAQVSAALVLAGLVHLFSDSAVALSGTKIALIASIFFVLSSLSSILLYQSQKWAVLRAIETERYVAALIDANPSNIDTVARLKSPHYLGRVVMAAYDMLIPSVGGLLAFTVMLAIKPVLTIIIILELFIFLPWYLQVARKGATSVLGILSSAKAHVMSRGSDGEDSDSSSNTYLLHYLDRVMTVHGSAFVGGIAIAVLTSTMVLWFSFEIYKNHFSLSLAIVYLFLLRLFGSASRAAGGFFTRVGTFNPYIDSTMVYLRRKDI